MAMDGECRVGGGAGHWSRRMTSSTLPRASCSSFTASLWGSPSSDLSLMLTIWSLRFRRPSLVEERKRLRLISGQYKLYTIADFEKQKLSRGVGAKGEFGKVRGEKLACMTCTRFRGEGGGGGGERE